MLIKIFLLLHISIQFVVSFQPPWMFMGRPLSGFRQVDTIDSINATEPEWFPQFLDHFGKNKTIWKQRYWKNAAFGEESSDLHFLILGGETTASSFDVIYEMYPHVQYAKKFNATIWTLEHRFYGESQPFETLETENLKYLSSHQALADIAFFIKSQNANLTNNPKWIIFGGSYAGTLALWFKKLYPDLSKGIVVSSAPIDLRLDFYDHLKYTEYLIETFNSDCAKSFARGFKEFQKYLTSDSSYKFLLNRIFSFNPSVQEITFTYENVGFIYSSLISYFQTAIQYSNVNTEVFRNNVGITSLCQIMAHTRYDDKYHNLQEAIRNITSYLRNPYYPGLDISYDDFILYLQDSNITDSKQASTRAWTWQVCNEFGNFLSTNGGKSIFGNHISYNFYVGICVDVFGKEHTIITTQYGLQKIKNNYGYSTSYSGTNVIAAKNSYDPWSILSLPDRNDSSIKIFEIKGTGHCADMAPISNHDNDSLKEYRQMVEKTIKKWIGE